MGSFIEQTFAGPFVRANMAPATWGTSQAGPDPCPLQQDTQKNHTDLSGQLEGDERHRGKGAEEREAVGTWARASRQAGLTEQGSGSTPLCGRRGKEPQDCGQGEQQVPKPWGRWDGKTDTRQSQGPPCPQATGGAQNAHVGGKEGGKGKTGKREAKSHHKKAEVTSGCGAHLVPFPSLCRQGGLGLSPLTLRPPLHSPPPPLH